MSFLITQKQLVIVFSFFCIFFAFFIKVHKHSLNFRIKNNNFSAFFAHKKNITAKVPANIA